MALVIIALGVKFFRTADLPVEPVDQGPMAAGYVLVDTVDILIMESFPLQARVIIKGNFGDACTKKNETKVQRTGNNFVIDISAQRPEAAICAQVLTPFEEIVALDVLGLPKGVYGVTVNGRTEQFELSTENTLAE